MTGALLVAVGICWASTELSGSDETAERVSPGRHQTARSIQESGHKQRGGHGVLFLGLPTAMLYVNHPKAPVSVSAILLVFFFHKKIFLSR